MERQKYIFGALALVLSLVMSTQLRSQPKYGKAIYDSYISGQMEKWSQVVDQMESENLATIDQKLELIEYYYGQTGYFIGLGQTAQAKINIEKAESLIDQVIRQAPSNASALSFKGVFLAFQMSINKFKAPVLGPLSMKYIKQAYQIDNNNVQALSDMGNMLYYAPSIFGGDKQQGMEYIERAIQSLEKQKLTQYNWYYLNLMVTLARFHKELHENEAAMVIYKKLLEIEPDFMWAGKELTN